MKASRKINPLVVLGSTINMVDGNYITNWLCDRIESYWRSEKSGVAVPPASQVVVTGFHGLNQAIRDSEYFKIGEECDLWVPDSIAPVLIAKKRGMKNIARTPGVEIMQNFFAAADKKGYSCFFYGDTGETLEALQAQLKKKYPNVRIAGIFSPPYRELTPEENRSHVDMINEAKPDVLWVGLGLPKQDVWIYRNKEKLRVPVVLGVGAAFGFFAGTTKRAPDLWQKVGLEWLYMLITKPKRTWKRIVFDGSHFIWRVINEELKR